MRAARRYPGAQGGHSITMPADSVPESVVGVQFYFCPVLTPPRGQEGCLECRGASKCGGRKEVPCSRCRESVSREVGRQRKSCEYCKRKGKMECPACGGTGKAGSGHGLAADQ